MSAAAACLSVGMALAVHGCASLSHGPEGPAAGGNISRAERALNSADRTAGASRGGADPFSDVSAIAGGRPAGAQAGRIIIPPLVWYTADASDRRRTRNFLGLLYHQTHRESADGVRERSLSLAAPLLWISEESEPSGRGTDLWKRHVNVLWWLFDFKSDNYGGGLFKAMYLPPFGYYRRGFQEEAGEEERIFKFWPLIEYRRSWRSSRPDIWLPVGHETASAGGGSDEQDVRALEDVRVRFLEIIAGYDREDAADTKRTFLLGTVSTPNLARPWPRYVARLPVSGGYEFPEKSDRMFALLAYERGPGTDVEHHLLWHVLLFRRAGAGPLAARIPRRERPADRWLATSWLFHGSPGTTVNLGPVSYESDWRADRRCFSILGGLFSLTRDGSMRQVRILWLPPARGLPGGQTGTRVRPRPRSLAGRPPG